MKVNDEVGISVEFGIDLLNRLMADTFKDIEDWEKKYDPSGTAIIRYVTGLKERYNTVKVLGMSRPVPLESLYVRANILEKITARMGMSVEELEKCFERDSRTFGERIKPVDGEEILNQFQKFIVLGKPGAGKTTYLKYLTLVMLSQYSKIKHRRLPIFVTLREWADDDKPLLEYLAGQFSICGFEDAGPFVEQMLKNGGCIVLFDGLDEVSQETDQRGIIRQVKDFTDKYRDNQFIISCRVAAYNHWFEQFTDVEMADFNEEQKETFIRNWFQGEPKVAEECWEKLNNNPQLSELASTPLLLTLLCVSYEELKNFPPNRSELYREAIDALLTKWDSTRNIKRGEEIYQHLTLPRKKGMLARIAVGTFIEDQYFIPERILAKQIAKFIENLPGAKPAEQLEPDSLAILKSIEARHGIFVERAKGIYSFAHLTFQEYFTAKYIVDHVKDEESPLNLEKLVNQHLYDGKWLEVFLLVTGMLDNVDELLLLMRKKNDEMLKLPLVNKLMKTAENSLLPTEKDVPDMTRRNLACFIALTRVIAHTHNRDLALARAVARARTVVLAIDMTLSFDHIHALERNLLHTYTLDLDLATKTDLDLGLDLDLDLDLDRIEAFGLSGNLDEQNALKVVDFLRGNLLIVECLQSDCFVSKDVRERILNEMLMPRKKG